MTESAWLYDGQTAIRHDVSVRANAASIEIEGHAPVAAASLTALPSAAGLVFGHKHISGWRLGFDTPPSPAITALLPAKGKYGGWIDRFGLIRTGAVLVIVSGALIFGAIQLPNLVAPHIPMAFERQFGAAMVGDLSPRF